MRLLNQFGIILLISFIGEILKSIIPLPIPASIYGLLIMFFLLSTKVLKLKQVKIAADFLIDIMPPMFIPAAVGLIVIWPKLVHRVVPMLIIVVVTTVIVMAVSGKTAQFVIRHKEAKDERNNN